MGISRIQKPLAKKYSTNIIVQRNKLGSNERIYIASDMLLSDEVIDVMAITHRSISKRAARAKLQKVIDTLTEEVNGEQDPKK